MRVWRGRCRFSPQGGVSALGNNADHEHKKDQLYNLKVIYSEFDDLKCPSTFYIQYSKT